MYNLTNITESNDYFTIAKAVNDLSGSTFASVGLFVLFIIVFMVFQSEGNRKKVLVADSFFVAIIAAFLFFADWISWQTLILPVIMLFVSTMVLIFGRD